MFSIIKGKISSLAGHGHSRTVLARKNVIASFLFKGISIGINLILVPLTINYINPERYGIWVALSSVILWFNFFDLGLGNGLRNHLAEAISLNNIKKAKTLISTAYASLILISGILAIVFLIFNSYINWAELLNVSPLYNEELKSLTSILLILFCIQFILQLINTINYALQNSSVVSAIFLLGSIFSLIFILLLKATILGSLFWMGIALFSGNVLALLLFTFYFFGIKRKDLAPSFRYVSINSSKHILSLGGKFFIMQLAAMVQYETANVLISHYFSPVDVTEYNIAYKMFSINFMIFGIIITPIWSAVTNAQSSRDYNWIHSIEKKLLKIWLGISILSIVLFFLSPYIYYLWIKRSVNVSYFTSLGVMLYILAITYGSIYVNILNGLGKIKTQFYLSIITMILFIPISFILAVKLNLGLFGVSLALIIANVNGLIAAPIEFRRIMRKNSNNK